MKKYLTLQIAIIFALFFALIVSPSYAQELKSELLPNSSRSLDLTEDSAKVKLSLTNTTNHTLYILKYETPIEGITKNLFEIKCNGEVVSYMGPMIFRSGPVSEDWLEIEPNETVSVEVELSKYYDMSKTGTYTVKYHSLQNSMSIYNKNFTSNPTLVESNEISIFVNKVEESRSGYSDTSEASQFGMRSCTNEQLSTLGNGEGICSSLASYGGSQVGNNSWYVRWFGYYNTSNADTVSSLFGSVEGSCGGNNYYCGGQHCGGGVVAYVYPSNPGNIWICDPFWGYGSTEQASIILHEVSHFHGTDDYAYGSSACQDLARNSPGQAIWNADNYRLSSLN